MECGLLKTCLILMNEDGGCYRITRQFLAIYFIVYADATEIYVDSRQESDTAFNFDCKNMANLLKYCRKWKEVLARDEPGI